MWIFPAVVGREQSWCRMRWPFWPCLLGVSLPALFSSHTTLWPSIFLLLDELRQYFGINRDSLQITCRQGISREYFSP